MNKLPTLASFASNHAKKKYSSKDYETIQSLLNKKKEYYDNLNEKERAKIEKAEEKIASNDAKAAELPEYQAMLDFAVSRLSAGVDAEDSLYIDPRSGVLNTTPEDLVVESSTKVM